MLYRVVTCLPCGYREAVAPGGSYPPRCPNDGSLLEHGDFELSKEQVRQITSDGRDARRAREQLRQVR